LWHFFCFAFWECSFLLCYSFKSRVLLQSLFCLRFDRKYLAFSFLSFFFFKHCKAAKSMVLRMSLLQFNFTIFIDSLSSDRTPKWKISKRIER
jgi:hypothetical protein